MRVSFDVSKADMILIEKIVDRGLPMARKIEYDAMEAHMDLCACIANGCPLNLKAMYLADDANFGHDFFGIRRHINRTTGKLENCFWPRFALRERDKK